MSEVFSTLDEFVKEYHGSSKNDETGEYGWWHNPQSKWDWYSLGGRWTGYFKLKKGKTGEQGKPGLMTDAAKKGWVDQALKKDIDFDGMIEDAKQKATERYEKIEKIFNGEIPKLEVSWEEIIDDNGVYASWDIDKKRSFYHNQESKKSWEKVINSLPDKDSLRWADISDYQISKAEYIQNAGNSALSTFAVLKDGKWYEKGKMGFWAMVSDEKDNWKDDFTKLFTESSEDTMFSVYDCHI